MNLDKIEFMEVTPPSLEVQAQVALAMVEARHGAYESLGEECPMLKCRWEGCQEEVASHKGLSGWCIKLQMNGRTHRQMHIAKMRETDPDFGKQRRRNGHIRPKAEVALAPEVTPPLKVAVTPEPEKVDLSMVVHPSHYGGDTPYEVIKVLNAWYPDGIPFEEGNTIKYIARAKSKGNELQDLLKAQYYLGLRIEQLVKEQAA